jgi:hypothetical protein
MDLSDFILKDNTSNKLLHLTDIEPITPFLGIKDNKFGVGFLSNGNIDYFYGEKISDTVDLFQAIKAVQVMGCLSSVENKTPEYCWKISNNTVDKKNISEFTNYLFPSGDFIPGKIVALVRHLSPSTPFLTRSLRFANRFDLKINIDRAINELDAEIRHPYQSYSLKDLMWGENARFYTANLDAHVAEMSIKRQILKHLQGYHSLEKIEEVIVFAFTQAFVSMGPDNARPLINLSNCGRKLELMSAKFEDEEFILKIKSYSNGTKREMTVALSDLIQLIQE